jgi:hypothetical protein
MKGTGSELGLLDSHGETEKNQKTGREETAWKIKA